MSSAPVAVVHLDGDRFEIAVRDHVLTVDQPVSDGGTDTAPTPTEPFVAALASCAPTVGIRMVDAAVAAESTGVPAG